MGAVNSADCWIRVKENESCSFWQLVHFVWDIFFAKLGKHVFRFFP